MNDTTESLTQKLLVHGRFASYELLKGAVNAYSARIGYGSKRVRADGKTRAGVWGVQRGVYVHRALSGAVFRAKFDTNGHFIRCALAPSAALDFLTHGLPLICVDMSHLYMRIRGQLALACSVDGNRQVMPLQWGISPCENKGEWLHFFNLLKEMYGAIISQRNIFFCG